MKTTTRKLRQTRRANGAVARAVVLLALSGCASMKSVFAVNPQSGVSGPIHNPFGDQYSAGGPGDRSQNVILRTKKGDRAVEIELPRDSQASTDFTIPVSPAFRDGAGRAGGAGESTEDSPYVKLPPTMADHEITRSFPQGQVAQDGERRQIEEGLGVMAGEDSVPVADQSYLGALDNIKLLYKKGRYEAGLVELDSLIKQYPTSPRLHVMRGTLLDRVGQGELALKSWNQALRLEPKNESLRRFIERREQKRSLASP
jgi:hypothetical protein